MAARRADAQKTETKAEPDKVPELPAAVRLKAPHGFIDEETEESFFWNAGQLVRNPDTIALLTERGAPIEPVE